VQAWTRVRTRWPKRARIVSRVCPPFGVILDGVVEQGRDRLIFVAALVKHCGCDSHQVRDVRDVRAFAELTTV